MREALNPFAKDITSESLRATVHKATSANCTVAVPDDSLRKFELFSVLGTEDAVLVAELPPFKKTVRDVLLDPTQATAFQAVVE